MRNNIIRILLMLVLSYGLISCNEQTSKPEPAQSHNTMVEDESQSPKPEISPTPKADQFKAEVKKQIEQRKAIGEPTRYAEEVVMAWDQPMGSAYPNGQWDLVYESVCADQKEYEGDVDKISEVAHRVNQYRIPLDELTTYNTIKFESVKIVGCPQG